MKSLNDLKKDGLKSKKIFLRVDFNVPLTQLPATSYQLTEIYRIKAYQKTINFLLSNGAKIGLVSHIEDSFKPIVKEISKTLEHQLGFEEDILNPKLDNQLTLFENIRKYEGEEKNDKELALNLSKGFDIYVNDAFSVSHRSHASVSAITEFLPSYAGFLMAKEIESLSRVIEEPAQGKTVILGGAKISTKLPVIKNFLDKAEHILIAGALANTIFRAKGIDIGRSTAEETEEKIDWDNPKVLLPKDIVVSESSDGRSPLEVLSISAFGGPAVGRQNINENQYILDIGPETVKQFSEIVKNSKTVIFNGPLGLAEVEAFSTGTKIVLDSIIRTPVFSVIGGGDTLALVERLGLSGKFGYVSTGGGAMLEFLAGNRLSGLEALGYYK